jgi:hypothetical protein
MDIVALDPRVRLFVNSERINRARRINFAEREFRASITRVSTIILLKEKK